jgi:hypothetical protein
MGANVLSRPQTRRHAPDYFAPLADGTGVVIDVRPDDRIEPRDAEAFAVTEALTLGLVLHCG